MMKGLRFLHRWLGLVLALPLLVQGLTGVVLTLEPAVESLGRGPVVETGSANAAVQAAMAAAPGARPARYVPPSSAGEPARVFLQPAGQARGPGLVALVDPATGVVLGPPARPAGAMDWLRRLHENWLLPELGGRQFAGWLGVGLVVLVVLGVPLWWPPNRWRTGFTVPRRATGAVFQRRLHGALGGWSMALLLATGLTGIVQGFPQTSRALLGLEAGRPGGGGPGGGGRGGPSSAAPDLDAAIGLARAAVPGGAVLRFAFLPPGGEPMRLVMGAPGTDGVTTATTVQVDAAGRRVVRVLGPGDVSFGEGVMRWAKDLHVGDGFGPVWRGLTAVTGVLLPGFGVTGFLLWWLKRRVGRRTSPPLGGRDVRGPRVVQSGS